MLFLDSASVFGLALSKKSYVFSCQFKVIGLYKTIMRRIIPIVIKEFAKQRGGHLNTSSYLNQNLIFRQSVL